MGIAKKLGLDRSGTPEELKREAEPLPERPSQANYIYIVCRRDAWPHTLQYTGHRIENETYKTKQEAEKQASNSDTILTCQVLQVDRRRTVEYTESVKRADEP